MIYEVRERLYEYYRDMLVLMAKENGNEFRGERYIWKFVSYKILINWKGGYF